MNSTKIDLPVPGALGIVVLNFVLLLPEPKEWLCSVQALDNGTLSRQSCLHGRDNDKVEKENLTCSTFVSVHDWHGSLEKAHGAP